MPYGDEKSYSFFKMKGSPMKRNFGIGASPAKIADVLITQDVDGERKTTVHKGDDAYTKGRIQEIKTAKAWKSGTPGTEGERSSEEHQETMKQRSTKVDFTGDAAYSKIKEQQIAGKVSRVNARRMRVLVSEGKTYREALEQVVDESS